MRPRKSTHQEPRPSTVEMIRAREKELEANRMVPQDAEKPAAADKPLELERQKE